MPDTESDEHHNGDAAVARLDLVAPPAAPAAAATSSSCATATATAHDDEEEDGFTFSPVAIAVPRLQLQASDCAFPDARIGGPVYPVFGRPRRSLSLPKQKQQQDEEQEGPGAASTATVRRTPLERLLREDLWCHGAPSASGKQQQQQQQPADDADAELDGVPAETYCLWYPGVSPPASAESSLRASPARHRKNGSARSPVLPWRRRRRVAVHVERSHSDGKDSFVFLGRSSDRDAGEGHGLMNRGRGARGGGKSPRTTSFLRWKQDLVRLVASTCRRSYLF